MDPLRRIFYSRRDRRTRARFYGGAVLVAVALVASIWLAAFDLRSQRRLVREVDRGLRADAILFAGRLEQIASGILYDEYLRAVLVPVGSPPAATTYADAQAIPASLDTRGFDGVVRSLFLVNLADGSIQAQGPVSDGEPERVLAWALEQQTGREGLGYRGQLGVGNERLHLVAEVVVDSRGERTSMRGAVIDPAALAGTVLPHAFERLTAELPADAERAILETIFAMRVETPDTTVQLISLAEGIRWSAVGSYLQPFTLGGLVPGWVIHVDWVNELRASGRRRLLASLIPLLIVVLGLVYVSRVAIKEMEVGAMKSAFVSNASHELKTPLTKIQFFNEMLESIPLDDRDKRLRYHGVIAHECKRLRLLVDNVLDLSRIEEGRQRFNVKSVSIEELVSDVVETLAVMYADDGYELALRADTGLPHLDVDPQAVKQVVINLIDNAIKFSKPHVIEVAIEKARRHGRPYVAVSVTDRGRGIPKEHLEDVFQEFYRVPDGSGETTTGTGLGLALVRQIVEAHGGHMEVESRVGQGSRFTMLLPIRRHKEDRSK